MSKVWTLDMLEALSNEELVLVVPKDIDKQFNRLPRVYKSSRIKGLSRLYSTLTRFYTIIEGYINLLNGDKLYIKETQTSFSGIN